MASRTISQRRSARPASRYFTRLFYTLLTLLGLMGVAVALTQLVAPLIPLRGAYPTTINGIPATVFAASSEPRPAVVIAHGFAGSQQLMYPFAVTLARSGYTVVTFDFPGHGQNATPLQGGIIDDDGTRSAQLDATLDEVVVFAHARSDGRVGLLGHSMGSEAVVRYAQEHPDAITAVVAVSLFYDGVTATSPANLLVLAGAFETDLAPGAQQIVDAAAGGSGQFAQTYGDFAEGTARRAEFAPWVEHVGVLFSPLSMAAARDWFVQSMTTTAAPSSYVDWRIPWIGLLYLSVILLFWPFSRWLQPLPLLAPAQTPIVSTWQAWLAIAILPALITPVVLRVLPVAGVLPILVGGPLAFFFLIYGLLTIGGLYLERQRYPASPSDDPRVSVWAQAWRGGLMYVAAALLVLGYVFFAFGLPTQFFLLNYFPPLARLPIFLAVFVAMLPYFLADEWLTRKPGAPPFAYAITKVWFVIGLILAIVLNLEVFFFLILIMPIMLAFFVIYGWFSRIIFGRTRTPIVAALVNSVVFAWLVAGVFPLVA